MNHTQGKLIVRGGYSIYTADDRIPVADTCLTNSDPQCDEDNARRLVACWNACENVSTEDLESGKAAGIIRIIYAKNAAISERDALRAVNAELVEACQELLNVYGIDDVRRWMALRDQARAALTKAKELKGL